jgi:type IV fimbrial biogenesis protein FimT
VYRTRYLSRARRKSRLQSRGFTLIELVVVVLIISILAVIAIPQITSRMRERSAQQAAQEIAMLFQMARMRAMGRGSAVLVRYVEGTGWEVREAVEGSTAAVARGANAQCAPQPVSGCTTNAWGTAERSRLVTQFYPEARKEYNGITTTVRTRVGVTGTATKTLDVCFTPLGRTFSRTAVSDPLTTMTSMADVEVKRTVSGRIRNVLLLPNGTARLAL